MRCYICNREIVEKPVNASQSKAHGEHIIHNGIRGKLITRTILCEECGGKYSKDDSAFCKIFDPFMAALGDKMVPSDHGKDNPKTLLGSLFSTSTFDENAPTRLITSKDGVVAPIEPYYEIKGNKITIYAEKHRIDQYINVLAKKLKANGMDINNHVVEKVTDIHDKGYLAYFFSKGNASFNDDFKKGIVKMATEYALECGVPREHLKDVLTINPVDGSAAFDCSKTHIFPFIPTSLFDVLYENFRFRYEEGYPSHTLKLFTIKYKDSTSALYCYVDLFSTFQYYVVLDNNYEGKEINKMYSQRLIPKMKDIPDASSYDPSDLNILIKEYGIDLIHCKATSYEEQVKYIQEWIRKYPLQTYDYQSVLNHSCERLKTIATAVLCKQKMPSESDVVVKNMLGAICTENEIASTETIIAELTKKMDFSEALLWVRSFTESIKPEFYRKFGFDVIDGEITSNSIPDESKKVIIKMKEAAQEYTTAKFSHLCCLCYNPSSIDN